MIINSGTIQEAFQSFNTVFNRAFQEMEAQYLRVAMEVPSETRDENYTWLGAVPSMREWIGDREANNLSAYGYAIRNKDFELTVSVPRNDLEDDRIGVYKPMFQDLAYKARKHPDKLVFGLFPKSFTEKCFDTLGVCAGHGDKAPGFLRPLAFLGVVPCLEVKPCARGVAVMSCGKDKITRLFQKLDQGGIGLIQRKKQGQGRPTRIYIKNFPLPPEPGQTPPPNPDPAQEPGGGPRLRETSSPDRWTVPTLDAQALSPPGNRKKQTNLEGNLYAARGA